MFCFLLFFWQAKRFWLPKMESNGDKPDVCVDVHWVHGSEREDWMRVGVLVRMGVICGHNITKNSNDLRAS